MEMEYNNFKRRKWIFYNRLQTGGHCKSHLTHTQLEIHEYVISIRATDALMLKHQAISSHSADYTLYGTSCIQKLHYDDVIIGTMASQITSLTIVYSAVYTDADQRKHQSSESLAFVWGIHRGPVNSPHKWPVTRKMFPFDDVIMFTFMDNNTRK